MTENKYKEEESNVQINKRAVDHALKAVQNGLLEGVAAAKIPGFGEMRVAKKGNPEIVVTHHFSFNGVEYIIGPKKKDNSSA